MQDAEQRTGADHVHKLDHDHDHVDSSEPPIDTSTIDEAQVGVGVKVEVQGEAEAQAEPLNSNPVDPLEARAAYLRSLEPDFSPEDSGSDPEGQARRLPLLLRPLFFLGRLLPQRRETRVGLAALISFLILVGVLLKNRGGGKIETLNADLASNSNPATAPLDLDLDPDLDDSADVDPLPPPASLSVPKSSRRQAAPTSPPPTTIAQAQEPVNDHPEDEDRNRDLDLESANFGPLAETTPPPPMTVAEAEAIEEPAESFSTLLAQQGPAPESGEGGPILPPLPELESPATNTPEGFDSEPMEPGAVPPPPEMVLVAAFDPLLDDPDNPPPPPTLEPAKQPKPEQEPNDEPVKPAEPVEIETEDENEDVPPPPMPAPVPTEPESDSDSEDDSIPSPPIDSPALPLVPTPADEEDPDPESDVAEPEGSSEPVPVPDMVEADNAPAETDDQAKMPDLPFPELDAPQASPDLGQVGIPAPPVTEEDDSSPLEVPLIPNIGSMEPQGDDESDASEPEPEPATPIEDQAEPAPEPAEVGSNPVEMGLPNLDLNLNSGPEGPPSLETPPESLTVTPSAEPEMPESRPETMGLDSTPVFEAVPGANPMDQEPEPSTPEPSPSQPDSEPEPEPQSSTSTNAASPSQGLPAPLGLVFPSEADRAKLVPIPNTRRSPDENSSSSIEEPEPPVTEAPARTGVEDEARSSAVTSRPESAPSTSPPASASSATATASRSHVVQSGENFWTIARDYYGHGQYYKALWSYNRKQVPQIDVLYVGTEILIPAPEALDRSLMASSESNRPLVDPMVGRRNYEPEAERAEMEIVSTPADAPSNPSIADSDREEDGSVILKLPVRRPEPGGILADPARPENGPRRPETREHIVRDNETLRSIARLRLGDPGREADIIALNGNKIRDPRRLPPGLVLRLPVDARPDPMTQAEANSKTIRNR